MNNIRAFIPCDASDAFVYGGYVFVVLKTGELAALPLKTVYHKMLAREPRARGILELAVLRNDWLINEQAKAIFDGQLVRKYFRKEWSRLSKREFVLNEIGPSDWITVDEVPDSHVLDFRFYMMRGYVATRTGTYEMRLRLDENSDRPIVERTLDRIFDGRTTGLSARCGEIVMSGGNEGLFHGSIMDGYESLRVPDKSAANQSFRTSWSGYDIVNYEEQARFSYLKNEIGKANGHKPAYSGYDESRESFKITRFADKNIDMSNFLKQSQVRIDDIDLAFNSLSKCFFLMENKDLVSGNINHAVARPRLRRQTNRITSLRRLDQKYSLGRPYSAVAGVFGTVIEYFDSVVLVRDGRSTILESQSAISVRLFPTSRRFQCLILITTEEGIVIHSVIPPEPASKSPENQSEPPAGHLEKFEDFS